MTNTREINSTEWQKVTSNACTFQNISGKVIKVKESATKPAVDDRDYKLALPYEMYTFTPDDGYLYAISVDGPAGISYDR